MTKWYLLFYSSSQNNPCLPGNPNGCTPTIFMFHIIVYRRTSTLPIDLCAGSASKRNTRRRLMPQRGMGIGQSLASLKQQRIAIHTAHIFFKILRGEWAILCPSSPFLKHKEGPEPDRFSRRLRGELFGLQVDNWSRLWKRKNTPPLRQGSCSEAKHQKSASSFYLKHWPIESGSSSSVPVYAVFALKGLFEVSIQNYHKWRIIQAKWFAKVAKRQIVVRHGKSGVPASVRFGDIGGGRERFWSRFEFSCEKHRWVSNKFLFFLRLPILLVPMFERLEAVGESIPGTFIRNWMLSELAQSTWVVAEPMWYLRAFVFDGDVFLHILYPCTLWVVKIWKIIIEAMQWKYLNIILIQMADIML